MAVSRQPEKKRPFFQSKKDLRGGTAKMTSHPLSLEKNRGIYLGSFFFSNFLIAYSALPLGFKLTLGLFGIFLPLYLAIRTADPPGPKETPSYLTDLELSIPLWLLIGGISLATFLRFYKLTTLFCWPTLDEGWNGILAIELSKHWTWKFFYTFGDAPPLPVWCAALLFKLGASPAFALWFPSAVVSLLTVPMGYLAARQFLSRSLALVCGGLLAFSYWPLFIGRFCHQGIWLPFWICLFLFLWGEFQKATTRVDKNRRAIGLGLGLGFGSFTFTPWIGVAGLLFVWVLWSMAVRSKKDKPYLPFFIGAFLASLVPFSLAVLREGFGHHIASLSPWGGWFKEFQILTNFFKYFAVLVWGAYEKDPAYTPVWGGFLNPLLGAFFFSGVIEMVRFRHSALIQWISIAFLFFLLPGVLSPNLETFRVAQVLPLLLFIVALGAHSFLTTITTPRRLWCLAGILAFTGAFDFDQLAKPYRDPGKQPENFGRPLKSLENYRAYQAFLKDRGLLLSHFEPDAMNDPTLSVMTEGIQVLPEELAKTLVLVNSHYALFLKDRFPKMGWVPLSEGSGAHGLALLMDNRPPAWSLAHEAFLKADLARFYQNSGPLVKPVSILAAAYPLVKGDPFLESVYWDKMAAYDYEDLDYQAQLTAYQMAVTKGYPTADLYYKLGQLLLVGKRIPEAKEAFLKATQAPMNKTPAAQILGWLRSKEASGIPSR